MTAGATLPDPPPAGQLRRAGIRDDEFRVVAPSQTWWRVHRIEAAFVLAWNEFRCYGPALRFAPHPEGPAREHANSAMWYGASTPDAALGEASHLVSVTPRTADASCTPLREDLEKVAE